MKPIRLPEPPASPRRMGGVPDIFEGGVHGVIRRAVIIGTGFPASENQSIGLVQALGLSDKHTLYVSSFSLFSNRIFNFVCFFVVLFDFSWQKVLMVTLDCVDAVNCGPVVVVYIEDR